MADAVIDLTTLREATLAIYRIQEQIHFLTAIAEGVFAIAATVAGYLVVKTIEMSKFMGRTEIQMEHINNQLKEIQVLLANVGDYLRRSSSAGGPSGSGTLSD